MKMMNEGLASKLFSVINVVFLISVAIITTYPLWYVLMFSLSDQGSGFTGGFYLIPKNGVHFDSYKLIFSTDQIVRAYKNTLFVVIAGTTISMILTIFTAYSLSIRNLRGRKFFMLAIIFTMLFNGGIIPTFIVVKSVGLFNSLWALILPGAIGVYNLIILINFFSEIPASLKESARIDGCSVPGVLFKIVLPLSKPALATLTLFYAVAQWNDFFQCMLYIVDSKKQVLQLILRNLILQSNSSFTDASLMESTVNITPESMKMATIMVATIPILLVYPFIQRYFVTGVTLGAVKE